MIKYNYLFLLMIGLVLISGCTDSNSSNYQAPNSTVERICVSGEEVCIVGNPGLINQDGVYSGSNSFFSIVLRNNVQGQEAKNVKVTEAAPYQPRERNNRY